MYDLIIIGSGPGGVAASIYASRYKLSHLIFGNLDGGLISTSSLVDNYPGMEDISGFELGQKFMKHVSKFNPDGIRRTTIKTIIKNDDGTFTLTDANGETYQSKTVLMALGTKYRRLGIPGENEFEGNGVTWCATCDAFFYKKKDVVVVGGGDSALEAAHLLAGICRRVYVVHRRDEFRAEPIWVDLVKSLPNVVFVMNNEVAEIKAGEDGKVGSILLKNAFTAQEKDKEESMFKDTEQKEIALQGVFIEIGSDPLTLLPNQLQLELDTENYVKVHADQSTSVPGVYAAGDFTTGSNKFRQVIPAMSEGVIAVNAIYNWLSRRG